MGSLLLHNPAVQFHLLYITLSSIAFIWDRLRQPGGPGRRQKNPRSVSKAERWTD
jgi:hypothetical protein